MRMLALLALCLGMFVAPAAAQARRTPPPMPNYQQYGSYSRQLTVYNNVRLAEERAERIRVRRIRDDLERRERATYIVRRGAYSRRSGDVTVVVRLGR